MIRLKGTDGAVRRLEGILGMICSSHIRFKMVKSALALVYGG